MKKLTCFIISILIGVGFLFGLEKYLDSSIETLLKEKNLVPIMNDALSSIKDKGVIANNYFLENKDIMMIGSSELGHSTKQHPIYYFNKNKSKNKIFTIGRAYTQNLQDATILASLDPNIKEKKVVLLVSLQWFMDKEGVTKLHYQGRFSPVQFYEFLHNPQISTENKYKFAKRASELLTGSEEYEGECIYAKLYTSKSLFSKIEKVLLYPYFEARQYSVKLKEKGELYKKLRTLPIKKEEKIGKPINWDYEMQKSIKDAKRRIGNNELHIDKGYYNKYFRDGLYKKKDIYKDVDLMKSKEFKDYKLCLDVCKDLEIKPIVVMLPCLDKFYNLSGISRAERYKFYDRAESLAKTRGFDVIDLRSKETEKYYLRDVMHIGTKGWVNICEKLFKKLNQ